MKFLEIIKGDKRSNLCIGCFGIVFAILFGIFIFNSYYIGTYCYDSVLFWSKLNFYSFTAIASNISL